MFFFIGSLSSILVNVLGADEHKTWDFVWRSTSSSSAIQVILVYMLWAFCIKSVTVCVFFMEILQIVNSALLYSNNEKTDAYAGVSSARLEKKQRLIHESVTLCDLVLSYERNEIWSIYNNNYFEIWTFYTFSAVLSMFYHHSYSHCHFSWQPMNKSDQVVL